MHPIISFKIFFYFYYLKVERTTHHGEVTRSVAASRPPDGGVCTEHESPALCDVNVYGSISRW